jgi:hypothetical protein
LNKTSLISTASLGALQKPVLFDIHPEQHS